MLTDDIAPVVDGHDYPARWKDYIGQAPARTMLQVAAKSAKMRRQPLDHVLIAHPTPGLGKTSLAYLVAKEIGTTCRVVSGQLGPNKARLLFADMEDGDVLFYDEIHQLMDGGKRNAEWMLHFLQDGVIMGPLGPERQPRITLVAATTDAGKLPKTIVDRFPIQPPMEEYNDEDAAKIAMLTSTRILENLPKLGPKEAAGVAAACFNNPRQMRKLLITLRDLTITDTLPLVKGRYDIDALLVAQGITADGLDRTAQQYLLALGREFGGCAGAKALEERLAQPGGLAHTERMLMDKGFVARVSAGRTLTQAGIHRFRALQVAS